jgi:hypothetical protein
VIIRLLVIACLSFFSFAILAQEAETPKETPCSSPEASQFDFWVGEWDLTWGENGKGINSIEKIMDGCVIRENFDGTPSIKLKGTSVSTFNKQSGKWQQTWVDNSGGYLDFEGGFQDEKMILSRELVKGGKKLMQRMVWFNISENEFDWNWERSEDEGESWTVLWSIHYTRKD